MKSAVFLFIVYVAGGITGFALGHAITAARNFFDRRRNGPLPPRRLPF